MEDQEMITFKTAFKGYEKESVHQYIQSANEKFVQEKQQLESVVRNQAYTIESVTARNTELETQMQAIEAERQALYDQAAQTLSEAQAKATELTERTDKETAQLRDAAVQEIEALRTKVQAETDALLAQAKEEAQRILSQANEAAQQKLEAANTDAATRLAQAQSHIQTQMEALEATFRGFGAQLCEEAQAMMTRICAQADTVREGMIVALTQETTGKEA